MRGPHTVLRQGRNPMKSVSRSAAIVAGMLLACCGTLAGAQQYPTKPIRIIVQFTPGTSTDILARVIAQKMGEDWGQQVVIDNRPGAGGVVGTELGAKATPDGYTLTMAVSSAFGINPTLYSKLPYDAIMIASYGSFWYRVGLMPNALETAIVSV